MSKIKTAKWVREWVRNRDKVCQLCGTKGNKDNPLTVHHIKHKSTHPHLVNNPKNCQLLCWDCHFAIHQQGG